LNRLFSEFKRRNVIRVAALYLVIAWLIAQVADVVIGLGELPPSVGRIVLTILAMGFPVAIVLAWFFEWTSEGIRRESEMTAGTVKPPSRHRMDYVILSLLLVALGYFMITHDWRGPPPATVASIAVLPLENRSAQPDDLYFTDGIHEDILTQLGKISSLVVISRTSVMQYRNTDKSLPEIASELGVATILEGGIQRAGNRVRVNLQLIDAASDRHLWAETYDRELSVENVFAIQSEIAASIAQALHTRLLPSERQIIETVPTNNLEAYETYLLGRRHLATRRLGELFVAREKFQQAIQIDPQYALAYTGLADTLVLLSTHLEPESKTLLADAENAAGKALALNPDLGEAHTSYGLVREYMGDPAEVFEPYLRRGVELAPGSADALKWYANHLGQSGQNDLALEQLQKAVKLDPMSPIIRVNLATSLRIAGRQDEALNHLRRALEIDPQFQAALSGLWDYGLVDEVLVATSRLYQSQRSDPSLTLGLVLGYLTLGDDQRAAQWADEVVRIANDSVPAMVARLNLSLYRSQEALAVKWAQWLFPREGGITVPSRTLLMYDLRRGDLEAALTRYKARYPELLGDDPEVTENYPVATDVAMLYRALGKPEHAERLLDRSLDRLRARPIGEIGDHGVFLARIHALKGNPEEALATLRQAVVAGWRFQWWFYLKQDPAFDSIRDDARFQSLVEDLSTEMAALLGKVRRLEANGEIILPPSI